MQMKYDRKSYCI